MHPLKGCGFTFIDMERHLQCMVKLQGLQNVNIDHFLTAGSLVILISLCFYVYPIFLIISYLYQKIMYITSCQIFHK